MKTLLVLGLILASLVAVAVALRRGSAGSPGYRRRLSVAQRFRHQDELPPAKTPLVWMPLMYPVDAGPVHGVDAGCTAAGHSVVDCGPPPGVDGGTS